MKRFRIALIGLVLAAALVVPALGSGGSDGRKILDFDAMAGVTAPFTGSTDKIRDLSGGGLPWEIDQGKGTLRSDGRLKVEVEGLVLARRAPVPANLQGTNPIPSFKAIVSCLTVTGGSTVPANVETGLVPATTSGDAEIETNVDLPSTCFAPIVFVTSPTGAWFAVTGR
jgi:hypothetical protein